MNPPIPQRILVTGAGGFVGHHLLEAFEKGVFGAAVALVPDAAWVAKCCLCLKKRVGSCLFRLE